MSIVAGTDTPPVLRASILAESGTCAVTGNFPYDGVQSSAISLSEGQGLEITCVSTNAPLDGITITASGTTNVILSF
jgi:hypothetical protein